MAALEALYDLHAEAVYRYVLGMLGRREDAEDAVQTIWLKLAQARLETVRDPRAYLWTAARHHVRTAGRRRAVAWGRIASSGEGTAEPEMLPAAENPGGPAGRRRDVESAILRLPARLRETVVLVGFEGLTLKEAGARLDIPADTAASRYRRAVKKLRARLSELRIDTDPEVEPAFPSVASDLMGDFVVVWEDFEPPAGYLDIQG